MHRLFNQQEFFVSVQKEQRKTLFNGKEESLNFCESTSHARYPMADEKVVQLINFAHSERLPAPLRLVQARAIPAAENLGVATFKASAG